MKPTRFALLAPLLSFAAAGCDGRTYSMSVDTRPLLSVGRGEAATALATGLRRDLKARMRKQFPGATLRFGSGW